MPAPTKSSRPKARPSKEKMDKMIDKAQEKKDVEALKRSVKYRAKGGSVNKKMGGGAMHKMPDGTMMPGKKHKMASGGSVAKKKAGGTMKMRGTGCATKGTKFYRNG